MLAPRKLIVVANRLPVSRVRRGGEAVWQTSPGGLVSALVPPLRENQGTWIGWSGEAGRSPEPFTHDGIKHVPVTLDREELAGYYEGFSNMTLWPLYHDCVRPPEYRRSWWRTYVAVNQRFADVVAKLAPKRSVVWVQDYHLQLVPGMLRDRRSDLRIGFFLHIPFPPQELFAQLPWRSEILEGLMGADLVGFQTRVGAQNFGQLARRFLGVHGSHGSLSFEGRKVRHTDFPISINFRRFDAIARTEAHAERVRQIRKRLGEERHILLGVDRLDYTKGIEIRLKAFREMLDRGNVDVENTILIQTAVPSRERVAAYQQERNRIERLIGEINGKHSQLGRPAVQYLRRNFPVEELVALYGAAQVMLVTPLRDGMNLVAKEYAASRPDERGALVLSEFTGAAHELRNSAIVINPYDVDGLTAAIKTALELGEDEQRLRMRAMRRVVSRRDVFVWANSFLEALAA
jgi:trehalose 6-phosphate synthase